MLLAAAILVSCHPSPGTSLVRIYGELTSTYAFEPLRKKQIAMFELVRHKTGADEILGRCDRRMWQRSGRQRFRLDMHVAKSVMGESAMLRVYILTFRSPRPYSEDARGLCTHREEEVAIRLKPLVRHVKLEASTSHALPGG